MATSDERMAQWAQRRQQRLAGLPWLASAGRARYVRDELLVVADARASADAALAAAGHAPGDVRAVQIAPGVLHYTATGMDVPRIAAALGAVATPNHVFLANPITQGGPYGPPAPTTPADLAGQPAGTEVPVAVIDTGLWRDSPLPAAFLRGGAVDYVTDTDVDHDGVLDGDVGHANFIGGVLIRNAGNVRISVTKVLDTFGMCTEVQLIQALATVPDDVPVVNLSLGGFTADDQPPVGLRAALAALLTGRDRVVVCAAGNDANATDPFWPAAFAGQGEPWSHQVVAVAAHDGTALCEWSNSGPWVSLAAIGADVDSTYINWTTFPSGWARWNGTSFAAPRVAAAIADRMADGTTATKALDLMLRDASACTYGGYPGIA